LNFYESIDGETVTRPRLKITHPPAPIENTGPTAKKQASWHQNQWFPFFGIEKTSSFISPENDSREVHVINSMTGASLN